jgi:hypothetical protein
MGRNAMNQKQLIDEIWEPPTSGKEYRAIWLIDDSDSDILNEFEVAIVETVGKRREFYSIATYPTLKACNIRIGQINNYLARLDSEWAMQRTQQKAQQP